MRHVHMQFQRDGAAWASQLRQARHHRWGHASGGDRAARELLRHPGHRLGRSAGRLWASLVDHFTPPSLVRNPSRLRQPSCSPQTLSLQYTPNLSLSALSACCPRPLPPTDSCSARPPWPPAAAMPHPEQRAAWSHLHAAGSPNRSGALDRALAVLLGFLPLPRPA